MKKRKVPVVKILAVVLLIILLIAAALIIYIAANTVPANQTALDAMDAMTTGDGDVTAREIPEGWLLDGPSEDTAVIFYTGFKVEEISYAPLLQLIARESADVFIPKMPLRIAMLDVKKADAIRKAYPYERWYIAGHSIGGSAAANYALSAGNPPDGLILLAVYLESQVNVNIKTLALYGSEDMVTDISKIEAMRSFLPDGSAVHCIDGGNHSQFGSYQAKVDEPANITPEEQWREAADWIHWLIRDSETVSAPDI